MVQMSIYICCLVKKSVRIWPSQQQMRGVVIGHPDI
jgi:hypothetical protein